MLLLTGQLKNLTLRKYLESLTKKDGQEMGDEKSLHCLEIVSNSEMQGRV